MQSHRRLPLLLSTAIATLGFVAATPNAAAQGLPGVPGGGGAGQAEPKTAEELVRVAVGVVGEAAPGATVRVAATFTIHPGWHIYWVNPGESGMPTQVTLELPTGCEARKDASGEVALEFPLPQVFEKGETTFGYERTVTLSIPVTLPKEIPAGGLPVTVRSRWLVCKEVCLMGQNEARVDLVIPVKPESALAKATAEALARAPKPLPADWRCAVAEATEESAVLTVEPPSAEDLRFLPYDTPGARLASGYYADSKGSALTAEIELSRESTLGKPLEVGGILVVGKNGPVYSFRVPVPKAK